MKYWLIVFFFTPQGEYIDKRAILTLSQEDCSYWQQKIKDPAVAVCVSDDHYNGIEKDANVEYD